MRIVIAGASGLIGTALRQRLREAGHDVRVLVRHAAADAEQIAWDPAAGRLDPSALTGVDGIVNLSGENIAAGRWTAARRERILRSRIDATRTLVLAVQKMTSRPAVFLSASAVGVYGDRGEERLTERSTLGHGFLPEVCLAWETHAEGAARAGIRTALLRFGVVLAPDGGALAKMLPLFRTGLGGRLGSGAQWMSWIALRDAVGAIEFALQSASLTGPVNVVAPVPVTNTEFTAKLGATLHRPTLLPAPAWALQAAFGQMAKETILTSQRALPEQLLQAGYAFEYPDLGRALHTLLARY